MTKTTHTYYAVETGADRYDMRQTRFAEAFKKGVEHANDVCATGFSAEQLRLLVARHKFDCDLSALGSKGSALVITSVRDGVVKYTFHDEVKITTVESMRDLAEDAANLEMNDEGQLLGVIYQRYVENNDAGMTGMSANTDELVM